MASRRGDCETTARPPTDHAERPAPSENLSERGPGLIEVEEIEIGDEVIIAFDVGRRGGDRTIWRDGDRGGVEKQDPIDETVSAASGRS